MTIIRVWPQIHKNILFSSCADRIPGQRTQAGRKAGSGWGNQRIESFNGAADRQPAAQTVVPLRNMGMVILGDSGGFPPCRRAVLEISAGFIKNNPLHELENS